MTHESFNKFCKSLPHTTFVIQWRGCLVWKVGGKVFAIGVLVDSKPAYTFKVAREDFEALTSIKGIRPAPYFASRGMSWVQNYDKPGLPDKVLKMQISQSYHLVFKGLTKKLQLELNSK
jgi:predicted DNA-binding protein (MmcQ/YjbR family)